MIKDKKKDEGVHPYRWRPAKELFKKAEKAAKKQSMSVNGFITEAVKEKMKQG